MRRAAFLIAVLAAVLGDASARAAETPPAEPGTHVEMPMLMVPMSQDGRLLGYAYVKSVLIASSPRVAWMIRDKVAFIQDAFVRDVNAAPLGLASDPTKVDRDLLARRLIVDARRMVGADKVTSISFGGGQDAGIQFASLHPREALQAAERLPAAPTHTANPVPGAAAPAQPPPGRP